MTNLSLVLLVIVASIQDLGEGNCVRELNGGFAHHCCEGVCLDTNVTVSQEMETENDRTNLILSALCVEQNGQISQECLNGLTSRNLYRTLYAALASPPRLGDVSSKSASRPGKLALPAKRRREDTSGFYSNW